MSRSLYSIGGKAGLFANMRKIIVTSKTSEGTHPSRIFLDYEKQKERNEFVATITDFHELQMSAEEAHELQMSAEEAARYRNLGEHWTEGV